MRCRISVALMTAVVSHATVAAGVDIFHVAQNARAPAPIRVAADSQYLNWPEAMTFVADGRFLLVEGGYLPTTGSLHLFRLP
jgi:hypothetical protein